MRRQQAPDPLGVRNAREQPRTAYAISDDADVSAYLGRLKARPAIARVLREAEPYFHLFPNEEEG